MQHCFCILTVKNGWEIEWKFSRSVMEEQYRRMHVVVVPFNILTLPIVYLYWGLHEDTGEEVLNQYQIGKELAN